MRPNGAKYALYYFVSTKLGISEPKNFLNSEIDEKK